MDKKIFFVILILIIACSIIIGAIVFNNSDKTDEPKDEKTNTTKNKIAANVTTEVEESENEMISEIKVILNGNSYILKLDDNETVKSFINMLPLEFDMNELNGNEKYVYLDSSLPTNSYNPKHINSGDVMLYGNNCLVIFYKSFDTTYSYTKIGHIDNLPDLGDKNINVRIEKWNNLYL